MRRAALLLVAALAGPAAAADPPPVHGLLTGRVEWSGEVFVDGDVEVAEGAHLVVTAGTRVRFAARDATATGWDPALVEVHVKGGLTVAGTIDRPVRFLTGEEPKERKPPEGPPDPARKPEYDYPWHGLTLWPPADPAVAREIRGAVFRFAYAAVQVPKGRARIEDCVFLRCGAGVEAGSAWADERRKGMAGGVARPLVRGCRFADCGTGVFAEGLGAPAVERCVFFACRLGVGNHRATGRYYGLQEPGAAVSRCDFLRSEAGVKGCAVVADSIFAGNETALSLSEFHVRNATDTEECAFFGNVFGGNRVLFEGECGAGDAIVVDEVGYEADEMAREAALRAEGPPLPAGLRLKVAAAARGRGAGGGDPGALAEVPPAPAGRVWGTARTRLTRPLAVDVAEAKEDFGRLRPAPGALFGERWWCAADLGGAGVFRVRDVFPRPGIVVALAYAVTMAPGGPAFLELNGDLAQVDVYWNGERLPEVIVPRRFGEEGLLLPVKGKAGANVLVLRARGRGVDPRIGVAVAREGEGNVAERAPEPAREAAVRSADLGRPRDRGGEPWLAVKVSTPLSWLPGGRVTLLDRDGREIPAPGAAVVVESRHVAAFGPLPDAALSGGGVLLAGFAAPDGAPLRFPATPFPVAPLPAR